MKNRRRLLWLLLLWCLLQPFSLVASDVPAPTQKVGNHSIVATNDPKVEIRDDELVNHICQQINAHGGKNNIRDVKLMVNSCYGGGLLDDMERAFGPGGPCEGIPWVGGSASGPEQTAKGWSDQAVNANAADKLGSTWTDGLVGNSPYNKVSKSGVIKNGSASNFVLQDLQAAGQNDAFGPNGFKKEAPQVASGNGGDEIQWKTKDAKHCAVVFGGLQTDARHHNNIENVATALGKTWEGNANTIRKLDGATKQELFDAIAACAEKLDGSTQLVIYIDDHGGSSFDFDEAIGGIANVLISDPLALNANVPDGWIGGLHGNSFGESQPLPTPTLDLHVTECTGCSNWQFMVNHHAYMFPAGGDRTGLVQVPLIFSDLQPGQNLVEIIPRGASSAQASGGKPQTHFGSLTLSRLELSTGPINELEADQILVPGQSAAFFDPDRNGEGIFVELLADGRAVVYVFSYTRNGPGQSWMLGVGEQVSEGIIVHDMLLPTGPSFGPGFDPNDVVLTDFGTLTFYFPTCGSSAERGTLFIYPEAATSYENLQSENYIQLSQVVDCETGVGSANSPLSGSWFDPSHDGEGIILEVLKNGTAVVQWFTYDHDGKQMWIQGTGSFNGNTLSVNDLFTTAGTKWGSGFNPGAISTPAWGSLTLQFTGCGEAELNYNSTAGFGSGTLNMVRLSNLMGITCTE